MAHTPFHVEVLTPVDRHATLVAVRIEGAEPDRAVEQLADLGIHVRAIHELDAIRLSFAFFTTSDCSRPSVAIDAASSPMPSEAPVLRTLPFQAVSLLSGMKVSVPLSTMVSACLADMIDLLWVKGAERTCAWAPARRRDRG